MVLVGVMQVSKGEKQPTLLPSCEAYGSQKKTSMTSNPKGAIVALIT